MIRVLSDFLRLAGARGLGLVLGASLVASLSGCCSDADRAAPAEPLKFENGVWVYLAPDTNADAVALERSGGFRTFLTDPDGNEWLIMTEDGHSVNDFIKGGYTVDWFVAGPDTVQPFYCQAFPKPPPPPDPMLDPPARCSVYLDAGHYYFARLERTADTVPCPSVTEYKLWLPRVEAHPIPFQIP